MTQGAKSFAYRGFLFWRGFYTTVAALGELSSFTFRTFSSLFRMKLSHLSAFSRVVINQIRFTGSQALPLISLIALLLGGGTIIQAVTFLPRVGREDFLGNLLKLVIVRELGPLITAIIVLTRSGSAIASELATQKLHREIEALELMGINTHMLMVLPRVIAGFVAVNILVVYFDFIAFVGGYAIAYMVSAFPFESFLENLIRSLSMEDLLSSLSKATILGISIPLLCSFYGLKPETLFEIPIFVSRAVVRSLIVVFSANALLSVIFYL